MKFFILLLILILPFSSAIVTDLRENYSPKETMIVKIAGAFSEPIKEENVEIKRNNVVMPVEYGIVKIATNYYYWAIAPNEENNYTLSIKDTHLTNGSIENYKKDFKVVGDEEKYSVSPGAVTSSGNFSIDLNVNGDEPVSIGISFPNQYEKVFDIGKSEIEFNFKDFKNGGLYFINIGEYRIPVYIAKEIKEVNNETGEVIEIEEKALRIIPGRIESIVLANTNPIYTFNIINEGEGFLNTYLDYNRNVLRIEPDERIVLEENESVTYVVKFNSAIKSNIKEILHIHSGTKVIPLGIDVQISEDEDEVQTKYVSENLSDLYKCAELKGNICSASQVCSQESVISIDGSCCLGICSESKSTEEGGSYWGYIIFGILILGGAYFWFKYKKGAGKNAFQERVLKAERV